MYETTSLRAVGDKGNDLSNYGNESSKLKARKKKQQKPHQIPCTLVICSN